VDGYIGILPIAIELLEKLEKLEKASHDDAAWVRIDDALQSNATSTLVSNTYATDVDKSEEVVFDSTAEIGVRALQSMKGYQRKRKGLRLSAKRPDCLNYMLKLSLAWPSSDAFMRKAWDLGSEAFIDEEVHGFQ
jgi:hypothetical protein